jgi:hypothetical protein
MNDSTRRRLAYPDLYGTPACPGAGLARASRRGDQSGASWVCLHGANAVPHVIGANTQKREHRKATRLDRLEQVKAYAKRRKAGRKWWNRKSREAAVLGEP